MATKRAAQALGKAMGFMIVLQRHLWLNLADLKDADHQVLLNATMTPSSLFGDVVESIIEPFVEAQKRGKAMSHAFPAADDEIQILVSTWLFPRRDDPRPGAAVMTATAPRQEPDVRRKAWVPGGSAMASGGEERRRAQERPAPKRQKFMCSNVWVLGVHSIKCIHSHIKSSFLLTQ